MRATPGLIDFFLEVTGGDVVGDQDVVLAVLRPPEEAPTTHQLLLVLRSKVAFMMRSPIIDPRDDDCRSSPPPFVLPPSFWS